MLKHEFYADPTVFDQWQRNAHDWFCERIGKLCPYAWSIAFLVVALSCVLTGAAVFSNLLLQSLVSQDPLSWNHFLAQALTVVIALTACHAPTTLAVKAWPDSKLPKNLARIAVWCGLPTGAPVRLRAADSLQVKRVRPTGSLADRAEVQTFFAEVRAAGVNVTIAKSLFVAGVRSAQQLRNAPDNALLRIHGVGPATLHRLRIRFGYR